MLYRLYRQLFRYCLILLALSLAACGGGGDSVADLLIGDKTSEPNPEDEYEAPPPAPLEDPAIPLSYSGNDDAATFSNTNAAELTYIAVTDHFTNLMSVRNLRDIYSTTSPKQGISNSEPESGLDVTNIDSASDTINSNSHNNSDRRNISEVLSNIVHCSSGSVHITSDIKPDKLGYRIMVYNNCRLGDATVNGRLRIIYKENNGSPNYQSTVASIDFNKITISLDGTLNTYSGIIHFEASIPDLTAWYTINALVEDGESGNMFRFSNYTMELKYTYDFNMNPHSRAVSGRVYNPVLGYFDIASISPLLLTDIPSNDPVLAKLLLSDETGASIRLTVYPENIGFIELDADFDTIFEYSTYLNISRLLAAENNDINDSDDDGLHDSWEIFYGFDPNVYRDNFDLDADNDLIRDIDEYMAGSDTNDSNSRPNIAELEVSLSDTDDPAAIGAYYTYSIRVNNIGGGDARDITAVVTLPTAVTVSDNLYECSASGENVVLCRHWLISPDSYHIFSIQVTAPLSISSLAASVDVSTVSLELNTTNNSATEETGVDLPVADVSLNLLDKSTRSMTGAPWQVTVDPASAGPQQLTEIELSIYLPNGIEFISENNSTGECTGDQLITCTFSTTPHSSLNDVTNGLGPIDFEFLSEIPGLYQIPFSISINGTDPDTSNNAASLPCFVGSSFTDIKSQIDSATDGETILVPPGYYYVGNVLRYSTNINLVSLAGPENTFISPGLNGIQPGTEGLISGFTFTNSDGISIGLNNSNVSITGNLFQYSSDSVNGAILLFGESDPIIEKNVFKENSCSTNGAFRGVVNIHDTSTATIFNNLVSGNDCHGVMVNSMTTIPPVVANNTFVNNDAALHLYRTNFRSDNTVIHNNIISDNIKGIETDFDCGSDCGTTRSNLLFNNGTDFFFTQDQIGINGNISADPLFVDPENSDYRLSIGSPAIDTGNATYAPADDLLGNPRPVDGDGSSTAEPDIGAYEYQ